MLTEMTARWISHDVMIGRLPRAPGCGTIDATDDAVTVVIRDAIDFTAN